MLKIKNSEFITSAFKKSDYPKDNLDEIVLVGKSNVGKSSFINTLVNRKNLAHSSSTPGKTRAINFYKIYSSINIEDEKVDKNFYFVDLPRIWF